MEIVVALGLALGSAADPVSIEPSVRPPRARPGETVTIAVKFRMAEGFHIYAHDQSKTAGTPTTFEVRGASLLPEGGFRGPAPKVHVEPLLGIELREYFGEAVLERTYRVAADAAPGELAIEGVARFQPCTEDSCLLPEERPFALQLAIEAGTGAGEAPPAGGEAVGAGGEGPSSSDVGGVEEALGRGLRAIIILSAGAALLSLITPCVFPMIPITISYFAQQAKRRAGAVAALALAYAIGIAGTYAVVGVALVLVFQGVGLARIATNPWVNLFLALLFVGCALSLLGFFELRLPQGLAGRLQERGRGAGLAGTALLGVSFTLISFSCTGPIIGPLFSALATSSHRTVAFAGILSYSIIFALPFFLLALFPKAVSALPRSGGWLETGKVTLGFLLLAIALKFATDADLIWKLGLIPRPLFLAAWAVIAALAGLDLLGLVRVGRDGEEGRPGPGRLLLGIAFLSLALFIGSGIGGRVLPGQIGLFLEAFPPPAEELAPSSADAPVSWLPEYEEARERGRADGKPLLLYFSGYACVKCRQMERAIFPHPEVRALFSRFIRVKLYADAAGEEGARARALQAEKVGAETVPVIRIEDPRTGERIGILAGSPEGVEAFASFLREALARAGRSR